MVVRMLHRGTAVVTGGAEGFGLTLGSRCAERGMNVALLDGDGRHAEAEAAALAHRFGIEAIGLDADVVSDDAMRRAADTVAERFGCADLVVAGASLRRPGGVEQRTDDEWRWLFDVNVIGAARTARAFLPLLRKAPGGRLAFIASSLALAPTAGMAAYQAGEFAIWGLAESLRLELRDEGIEVSVVFPSEPSSCGGESGPVGPERPCRLTAVHEGFGATDAGAPGPAHEQIASQAAARDVIDTLMAGERYVVTHEGLFDAVVERSDDLLQAALDAGTRAREPRLQGQTHHAS